MPQDSHQIDGSSHYPHHEIKYPQKEDAQKEQYLRQKADQGEYPNNCEEDHHIEPFGCLTIRHPGNKAETEFK
jgi:hypothetical protein